MSSFTTITATNIKDANGQPLASGRVTFTPGLAFIGSGPVLKRPVTFLVSAGEIGLDLEGNEAKVVDTATTTPTSWYKVEFFDETGAKIDQPGYDFVEPTGATWSLDSWRPKDQQPAPTIIVPQGDSAYQVAVDNGFEGTETEWLASLRGPEGNPGSTGAKGDTGSSGGVFPDGSITAVAMEDAVTTATRTLGFYSGALKDDLGNFVTPMRGSTFTLFTDGTTVFAQDDRVRGGSLFAQNTDAAVVLNACLAQMSTSGGIINVKNGVYHLNSVTSETTHGYSGISYCVGMPSSPAVAYGLVGESDETGVQFKVTAAALASAGSDRVVGVWQRPGAGGGYAGYSYMRNILVSFPDNTRAGQHAFNYIEGGYADWQNLTARYETALTGGSTATGASDNIGFVTPCAATNGCFLLNCIAYDGWETGFAINDDHSILTNCSAYHCTYAYRLGTLLSKSGGPITHGCQLNHCQVFRCIHGIDVGSNINNGVGIPPLQVDIINLDIEYTTNGSVWDATSFVRTGTVSLPNLLAGYLSYMLVNEGGAGVIPIFDAGHGLNYVATNAGLWRTPYHGLVPDSYAARVAGGNFAANFIAADVMSPVTSDTTPCARMVFRDSNPSGSSVQEALIEGVNKYTATNNVPSLSVFLTTLRTSSTISIGRGDGAGNPNKSDIFIGGTGLVAVGNPTPTQQAALKHGLTVMGGSVSGPQATQFRVCADPTGTTGFFLANLAIGGSTFALNGAYYDSLLGFVPIRSVVNGFFFNGSDGSVHITSDSGLTPGTAYSLPTDVAAFTAARLTIPGAYNAPLSTPASSSAAGTAGDMKWDANYVYVCVATNTWKRVAIATW